MGYSCGCKGSQAPSTKGHSQCDLEEQIYSVASMVGLTTGWVGRRSRRTPVWSWSGSI